MTVQIGYGPLERIDGPPPLRPQYGLLQGAEANAAGVRIVPDNENGIPRWANGGEVYPYPPDNGDAFDQCQTGSDADTKDFGDEGFTSFNNPLFSAMTIYLAETCKSYKVWDQDEFKARAFSSFAAVESSIIAHEFLWGSRLPLNPHLADGSGTFPSGNTPQKPTVGLARLEAEIAASGKSGLIHVSPFMTTVLQEKFWFDHSGGVIRTINGTVIIPDAGYTTGPNPAGHPVAVPPQEWMYATGPIDIRRSETFVLPDNVIQALDRSVGATNQRSNQITYRVERLYLVDWDTIVHASVLVDPNL